MYVYAARLHFALHDISSLKEKRQIARSLMDRARHKFHLSIAEVDRQDSHHALVLGLALVSGDPGHGRDMLEQVLRYLEEGTEAELLDIAQEDFRLA